MQKPQKPTPPPKRADVETTFKQNLDSARNFKKSTQRETELLLACRDCATVAQANDQKGRLLTFAWGGIFCAETAQAAAGALVCEFNTDLKLAEAAGLTDEVKTANARLGWAGRALVELSELLAYFKRVELLTT